MIGQTFRKVALATAVTSLSAVPAHAQDHPWRIDNTISICITIAVVVIVLWSMARRK